MKKIIIILAFSLGSVITYAQDVCNLPTTSSIDTLDYIVKVKKYPAGAQCKQRILVKDFISALDLDTVGVLEAPYYADSISTAGGDFDIKVGELDITATDEVELSSNQINVASDSSIYVTSAERIRLVSDSVLSLEGSDVVKIISSGTFSLTSEGVNIISDSVKINSPVVYLKNPLYNQIISDTLIIATSSVFSGTPTALITLDTIGDVNMAAKRRVSINSDDNVWITADTLRLFTNSGGGVGHFVFDDSSDSLIIDANANLFILAPDSVVATTNRLSLSGDLKITTAGKGLSIKEGSNARMGRSVMVGGTVTVNNTSVTANTEIFITVYTVGGVQGMVSIGTVTPNTSFTIISSNVGDTSTVSWMLVEPN